MLAVIRVRFPNTPAADVWSDAAVQSWMDPNIPFSLGHYWSRASFFQADMRYFLFPPVSMGDPRADTTLGADVRTRLVRGVLAEVTRQFDPDWDLFDQYIIWFAQPTDLFGGGSFPLPTRPGSDRAVISGAVCDIASPFSTICQEVGHGFGFDHELDDSGNEYGDPYSAMSTEAHPTSFERPADPRLPVGVYPPANMYSVVTNDVQRIIGPYITPVQFCVKNFGAFVHPDSVHQVPSSYGASPVSLRLTVLDKAIDVWPGRKTVLAVLPPLVSGGDTYFLELRRKNGYDKGLKLDTDSGSPAGVVIHAVNPVSGRIRYVDRIPFRGAPGDRDYHSFKGHFTVRLNSFEEDFSSASLTVGGGDFWKHFGVSFEDPLKSTVPQRVTDWTTVEVAPCVLFGKSMYQYRYHYETTQVTMVASSFGYEKPHYRWFINDQYLDPANSELTLTLPVRVPAGQLLKAQNAAVVMRYKIVQNRVELTVDQLVAGVYVTVKAVVNESSSEVIQSYYQDQSVWTGVNFDNVRIEWDRAYVEALAECWKKFRGIEYKYSKSRQPFKIPVPEPDPKFQFDRGLVSDLLHQLVQTNPVVANVVIDEVSKLANISRLDILKGLQR